MEPCFLGLDLGGTSVKAGVVDATGKVRGRAAEGTGPAEAAVVIGAMVKAAKAAMAQAECGGVVAVGIVAPGPASVVRGVVHRAANFPAWSEVPLRAEVTRALGVPGLLENDANAAAFGEYWAGAGKQRKVESLAILTLGTGMGGGFVQGGQVFRGAHGAELEVGHTILVPGGELCGCGQRGCVEVYCSGEYTARRAVRVLRETSCESLLRKAPKITAADVAAATKAGDALAIGVWDETCKHIALAAINCIHVLDPEVLVLAGGMSQAGALLIDGVSKHVRQQWWKITPLQCEIRLAELGADAGMIGAAGLAKRAWEERSLPAAGM